MWYYYREMGRWSIYDRKRLRWTFEVGSFSIKIIPSDKELHTWLEWYNLDRREALYIHRHAHFNRPEDPGVASARKSTDADVRQNHSRTPPLWSSSWNRTMGYTSRSYLAGPTHIPWEFKGTDCSSWLILQSQLYQAIWSFPGETLPDPFLSEAGCLWEVC